MGKPTRAADFRVAGFITPQPVTITQSGLNWRISSHCACCSLPGAGTSMIFASKPYFLACSRKMVFGSFP